jgi:hypothetical protein
MSEEIVIDDELRTVFAGLADVLIPAGAGMPSGGEVALGHGALEAVLGVRPDVVEGLVALLEGARGADPAAEVDRLRADDPDGFQLLTTVVAGGYFLDDGVREALGYRGQQAVPIEPQTPPDYEQDGLLASVIERGPIYRPTPPE